MKRLNNPGIHNWAFLIGSGKYVGRYCLLEYMFLIAAGALLLFWELSAEWKNMFINFYTLKSQNSASEDFST